MSSTKPWMESGHVKPTKKSGSSSAASDASDRAEEMDRKIYGYIRKTMGSGRTRTFTRAEIASGSGAGTTYISLLLRSPKRLEKMGLVVESRTDNEISITVNDAATSVEVFGSEKDSSWNPATLEVEPSFVLEEDLFIFDPILQKKIEVVIARCRNLWLAGPTGCGKSEGLIRIMESKSITPCRINFNGESSVDDLLGHYVLREGKTEWIEGAMTRAMKTGVPLLCEEIDAAPAEANMVLLRVLEQRPDKPRSFYNARNGEEVTAVKGFCVLATANTAGGGDSTGLYTGTQPQNLALRNRFLYERMDYLPEAQEIHLLRKRSGLTEKLARGLVQFASSARMALKNGEIFTAVSTRSLLEFASFFNDLKADGMGETIAIREALKSALFYTAASPTDEEVLKGLAQRILDI